MASPDDRRSPRLMNLAIGGAVAIVALWALSGVVLWRVFDSDDRGTFGDMFGAINALFSGLAFLGLTVALVLQYEELKEQRREIQQSLMSQQASNRALEEQLKMSDFRNRIETLNLLIQAQQRQIDRMIGHETLTRRDELTRLNERLRFFERELEHVITNEANKQEQVSG
jgi:hypothetical protein